MLLLDTVSGSEAATEAIAADFARTLTGGEFIALNGDLGAGKTVFVRGLAAVLAPEGQVSSPSYAIVHEYGGDYDFCHFDLYRITGEDDLYSIGFYDYEGCIMAVEWSEKLPDPPAQRYEVTIEKSGERDRHIKIEKLP